jgi:hypothetical protein
MNQWPKLQLKITNTCSLWFNIKLPWHIFAPTIKTWLYLGLSKIFALLRMNSAKVIFHKVVNQQVLNGSLVKKSWHLLFLRFNLMRVKAFHTKKTILNNKERIVKECLKNAINIWNSVLKIWYTNMISLQLLFIQI